MERSNLKFEDLESNRNCQQTHSAADGGIPSGRLNDQTTQSGTNSSYRRQLFGFAAHEWNEKGGLKGQRSVRVRANCRNEKSRILSSTGTLEQCRPNLQLSFQLICYGSGRRPNDRRNLWKIVNSNRCYSTNRVKGREILPTNPLRVGGRPDAQIAGNHANSRVGFNSIFLRTTADDIRRSATFQLRLVQMTLAFPRPVRLRRAVSSRAHNMATIPRQQAGARSLTRT